MPARKILRNYRSVTGLIPSQKKPVPIHKPYESPLERDYYLLLEFDPLVIDYDPQPFQIKYRKPDGRPEEYYPDTLVHYRPVSAGVPPPRNLLVEVKPRQELRDHWAEFEPAFRAAWRFALERGWGFKTMTEREIRGPYLENLRFLVRYRSLIAHPEIEPKILAYFTKHGGRNALHFLEDTWTLREDRAKGIPYLWRLLAKRIIHADLNTPLNMRTPLWTSPPPPRP